MKIIHKRMHHFFSNAIVLYFIIPSFAMVAALVSLELTCGSDDTKDEDVDIPAHYVQAADTSAATIAYAKWAGKKSGIGCKGTDCLPAGCIPYVIGFGGAGNYPTPTVTADGRYCFPAYDGEVTVRCDCFTDARTVYVLEFEGYVFPFDDPLIGNDSDDEELLLRNLELGEKISVYPNPTRELLTVNFEDLELAGVINLRVYDAVGRVMHQRSMEISKLPSAVYDIETSFYPAGIYYLAIVGEDGVLSKSKFMVAD